MFDRTIFAPEVSNVTESVTKHVHEHRAPTDESVRLLSEMETAARDKIVEAVHVGDTTFECVVHTERQFVDNSTRLIAIFSLNGKKLTVEHVDQGTEYDPRKALVALRDAVAVKIATEILIPALKNMEFSRGRAQLTPRSG